MNVYSLAFFRSPSSGYESPRAGTSQGIFFDNFIPTVLRAARAVWRGWEIRIHHDGRVKGLSSWPLIGAAASAGMVRLVPMGEVRALCEAMLWRVSPLAEPDVEWVVCRDVDSLPMERDRLMVEEAMRHGGVVSAILDSESHSGPLMGGMTAFHASVAAPVLGAKRDGIDMDQHGADQKVLNREVWPSVFAQTVIHQRRRDIRYPEALKTLAVAPQATELDKVVRHIGAGYDRERAAAVLREFYPDPEFDAVEARARG